MTIASARDMLRLRMLGQRLAPTSAGSVSEVIAHFLAMQAQDFGQALWALGARDPGSTRADVLAALERGEIVRSWPMRGTLHWVDPADLGWMLALTVPRQHSSVAARYRQLELDDRTFGLAAEVARAALEGGRRLGRIELLEAFERAGIATSGQRGPHLIGHLSQLGLIVQGPPEGSGQANVLLDEWVPTPRRLDRDAALREFAVRYFRAHGPATVQDFCWWSKLTVADAKTGIALAGDELAEVSFEGRTHWMAASVAATPLPRASSKPLLLAGFDEYLLGYQDRSLGLPAEFAQRIVPGENGVFLPMIVVGGRIVGTWKRAISARGVRITAEPFEAMTSAVEAGIARKSAEYARFLGLPLLT